MSIIYTYFRVPEPSGRTFAEMDVLFQKGVSARKFNETSVDVFHENIEGAVLNNYEKRMAASSAEKERAV